MWTMNWMCWDGLWGETNQKKSQNRHDTVGDRSRPETRRGGSGRPRRRCFMGRRRGRKCIVPVIEKGANWRVGMCHLQWFQGCRQWNYWRETKLPRRNRIIRYRIFWFCFVFSLWGFIKTDDELFVWLTLGLWTALLWEKRTPYLFQRKPCLSDAINCFVSRQ